MKSISFPCLALIFMASGCVAYKPSKDIYFDESSETGLLIFAVESNRRYVLTFRRYDPETCDPIGLRGSSANTKTFDKTFSFNVKEKHHLMANFQPGHWLIYSVKYSGFGEAIYSKETLAFEVKAGESYYLGDLSLEVMGINIDSDPDSTGLAINYDNEALHVFLKGFPNLSLEPEVVKTWTTGFKYGRKYIPNCPAYLPGTSLQGSKNT